MNINTLNNEPITSKTGNLAIALYPAIPSVGKKQSNAYFARVINRSRLQMDDIANDIVASGINMSKEDILKTWKVIDNAVTCRLAEGISVDIGLGTLRPAVFGTFESATSTFDRNKNRISVQYRPGKQLAETMENLTPVISLGNRIVPEIISVQDKTIPVTPDEPEAKYTLRSGGFFSIAGKNILIAEQENADMEESPVGLYFDNTEDSSKTKCLKPHQIYHNSSTLLEGIIPELESGTYKIRIATRLAAKSPRKNVLEHTFDKEFKVL